MGMHLLWDCDFSMVCALHATVPSVGLLLSPGLHVAWDCVMCLGIQCFAMFIVWDNALHGISRTV